MPGTVNCAHCGKATPYAGSVPRKFCSKECTGLARRNRATRACECCGKIMEFKACQASWRRFCSADCKAGGIERIRALYELGLTSAEIAPIVGRNEGSIRRTARTHGYGRDRSEAMRHRWANANPLEREQMLSAAHEAARGSTHSIQQRTEHAYAVGDLECYVGPHEVTFAGLLDARGIAYDQQTPCGPYNIDFTLAEHRVAVEIVAGGGNARVRADRPNRLEQVLNGWHLIEVKFQTPVQRVISPLVVDQVVTYTELVAGLPPFPGKHRMVRTDGQMITPRSHLNRYLASRA